MTDGIALGERLRLAQEGMYRPEFESDACGVGLVAATDGQASRRVVTAAIDALRAVWHRGAVDADGMTGDGAGLHVSRSMSRSLAARRRKHGPRSSKS